MRRSLVHQKNRLLCSCDHPQCPVMPLFLLSEVPLVLHICILALTFEFVKCAEKEELLTSNDAEEPRMALWARSAG